MLQNPHSPNPISFFLFLSKQRKQRIKVYKKKKVEILSLHIVHKAGSDKNPHEENPKCVKTTEKERRTS